MSPQGMENELEMRVAESVGRVIWTSVNGSLSGVAESRSFALVEQQLARRGRHLRRVRTAVVMVVALVGGGAYWGRSYFSDRTGQQITYEVGRGVAVRDGDLVAASANTDRTDVRFSDGSLVRMDPRTRGRVVGLDRNGAKIALYEGKLHADVRHRANATWLFEAGPFEVKVHGTAFSISWNAASARFDLQMDSGVVSVAGPISGGEIVLEAGQRLSVTLSDHDAAAGPGAAAMTGTPGNDGTTAQSPPEMEAPGRRRPEPAAPLADRAAIMNRWRAELAEGHASAVIADAQRSGFGRVLDVADSEDLAALADAARYVGREDLARRALHTQRRRFPGTKRAAEASFLLGRLEDESPAGAARALGWYERYLTEAPSGAYASEALGRKMRVLERSGQHEGAVAIARLYLSRFPSGSYAHAASVLAHVSEPVAGLPRSP
jgi:TolA-binding protein